MSLTFAQGELKRRDTGVKAILKDLHNRIRLLEQELTEVHRKLEAESRKYEFSRQDTGGGQAAGEWLGVIAKHKE